MQKLILIAIILLCLVTIGLFPLDLFVLSVPEWVIYALLGVIAALTVMIFIVHKKKAPKITAVILTVITAASAVLGIYIDPYFNSITLRSAPRTMPYDTVIPADKAIEDLKYVIHYFMKDHPVKKVGHGEHTSVLKIADDVESKIEQAGSVTVNELCAYIETALSQLGDAHTTAYTRFNEPLFLRHYAKWQTGNWKIAAINGISIKELLEQKKDLYSFEAESWELEQLKAELVKLQGLDYLGFSVQDGVTYTYENDEGEVQEETYYPEDFVTYEKYYELNPESPNENEEPFVSFTIDEEKSLAVFTLKECIYNNEYVNTVRDMFTQVKDKNIQNIAVDLRGNGGGNDHTAVEFIRYLDTDGYKYASETMLLGFFMTERSNNYVVNERYSDLTFSGNLYILTSSGSFSSAMLFPQYIKDNGLGTLIGEPPGNDPNGYGEIATFRTPNAGIFFSISTKRFYRADQSCTDKYVMPDIDCEANSALDVLYDMI